MDEYALSGVHKISMSHTIKTRPPGNLFHWLGDQKIVKSA